MSRRGTVLVSGELTHLPMLLGDLETLVIDEFPEEAKAAWEKQRDLVIEETESGGRFGPRFGPPIPMPGSTSTTQHTAKEIIQFTIAETSDDIGPHQQEVLAQERRKGQGRPLRHDRLGRIRVRPQGRRDQEIVDDLRS